jgi:hypothetical protein
LVQELPELLGVFDGLLVLFLRTGEADRLVSQGLRIKIGEVRALCKGSGGVVAGCVLLSVS